VGVLRQLGEAALDHRQPGARTGRFERELDIGTARIVLRQPPAGRAPVVCCAMSEISLERLDHFVLTVADVEVAVDFYTRVLGMRAVTFGDGRRALHFGAQKINLHRAGHEFEPKAGRPAPGSADFCLISAIPIDEVAAHLESCGVPIELGPVARTGAQGPMTSIYFRDPDGNLLEVSTY